MRLVQANAKWLTALACCVMLVGAAMVVGQVGHEREHAEALTRWEKLEAMRAES